jgi:hypothetical protein
VTYLIWKHSDRGAAARYSQKHYFSNCAAIYVIGLIDRLKPITDFLRWVDFRAPGRTYVPNPIWEYPPPGAVVYLSTRSKEIKLIITQVHLFSECMQFTKLTLKSELLLIIQYEDTLQFQQHNYDHQEHNVSFDWKN